MDPRTERTTADDGGRRRRVALGGARTHAAGSALVAVGPPRRGSRGVPMPRCSPRNGRRAASNGHRRQAREGEGVRRTPLHRAAASGRCTGARVCSARAGGVGPARRPVFDSVVRHLHQSLVCFRRGVTCRVRGQRWGRAAQPAASRIAWRSSALAANRVWLRRRAHRRARRRASS